MGHHIVSETFVTALFIVIRSQTWAEQFLSSGSAGSLSAKGVADSRPGRCSLGLPTVRWLCPHGEAMIPEMGRCVLDEGAVLGTFLLLVSYQPGRGDEEGYGAQS